MNITLRLYDCAGDNSTQNLLNIYWQGVNAIVLVYSIDSNQSFDRLQNWIDAMNRTKKANEVVHIALVASKSDLQASRLVPTAQGFQLKDTICASKNLLNATQQLASMEESGSIPAVSNKCFMFKETSA